MRSILVRDSTVSAWSQSSVSPISGKIAGELPVAGTVIGEDGEVAVISNELLLEPRQTVEKIRDRVMLLRSKVEESQKYVRQLKALENSRRDRLDRHIAVFRAKLDANVSKLSNEIIKNEDRLAVLRRIADRQRDLIKRGSGTDAKLDSSLIPLGELQLRQIELNSELRVEKLRLEAAADGLYIMQDGASPNWVEQNELQLQLELRQARRDLHLSRTSLSESLSDLMIAQKTLKRLEKSKVTAPPGSVILRVPVSTGSTIAAGIRVVDWFNCSQLIVDVPVPGVQLALLKPGSHARVLVDGETNFRAGKVILTRGSTALLDRTDLAAKAAGRKEGDAQVLVQLEDHTGFSQCPVGRSAFVEFPEIGLFDFLKARLRL